MLNLRKRMEALRGLRGLPSEFRAYAPGPDADIKLAERHSFGSNPGNLRMLTYMPSPSAKRPALVVVLHGCGQTAAGYDLGAGWSTLADRYGFALLMPQQQPANNPNGCFNWFLSADI